MNKQEFLKKLEIELKISKNSPYTIEKYTKANQNLLEFSGKDPDQLTEDDVKAYIAENLSDHASLSIIVFLAAIRYSFSNILKNDIAKGIKRPKKEKHIPTVLSKEEVMKMIDLAFGKSKLMISMLYACGFRVSELTNLKVNDLKFAEKRGYVRKGKGKKDRAFNIPEFIFEELKQQAEKQKSLGQEYLFSGPNGKLTTRNLQKIVEKLAQKANIDKDVHPHTLRHSFATHLLEDGVNLVAIQELLGHENLETTSIYTHISQAQIRNIKSPLDSLMEKK